MCYYVLEFGLNETISFINVLSINNGGSLAGSIIGLIIGVVISIYFILVFKAYINQLHNEKKMKLPQLPLKFNYGFTISNK